MLVILKFQVPFDTIKQFTYFSETKVIKWSIVGFLILLPYSFPTKNKTYGDLFTFGFLYLCAKDTQRHLYAKFSGLARFYVKGNIK